MTNKCLEHLYNSTFLNPPEIATRDALLGFFDSINPLNRIIGDMWRSFDSGLYYPALLIALTLPDTCVGATLPEAIFLKHTHYESFIEKYAPKYSSSRSSEILSLGLDAQSCYRLRGGIVHRANGAGHAHWLTDNVIFTVKESALSVHGTKVSSRGKTALSIDLKTFCKAMERAVSTWYLEHRTNPEIRKGILKILTFYPDGIYPFTRGDPVIASGAV